MSFFKNLIFIICAMLIFTTNVYAWSSADNLHDAFATHQFLNKKAYQAIREHPAFNSSGFPSLDDIQRHGSVTITKKGVVGLGPDKEGNSNFSQHWYNPKNKQGKAPETTGCCSGTAVRRHGPADHRRTVHAARRGQSRAE